jgi:hypothetical protein
MCVKWKFPVLEFLNTEMKLSTSTLLQFPEATFFVLLGRCLRVVFSQPADAANVSIRLNRITLVSQASWKQNGHLAMEINAGKTHEWRTRAKMPTFVGL